MFQIQTTKLLSLVLLVSILAATSGCVFRSSISQGNIVESEDVEQLEVGMTTNQVRFLLGTPMIDDPFNAERWDYVYYLNIARDPARAKRWVSISFEDGRVTEIRDDLELSPNL